MNGASCRLKDKFVKMFLTLEDERLIYSTRQHWTALIPTFSISTFLLVLILAGVLSASIIAPSYVVNFIIVSLVFISLILVIVIKQVVEWYFHFYIVTSRKIVEVSYRPLFSREINEILLDQVRCTEIDVVTRGFFNEMYSIGNVLMTFDRPTHEETFTIEKIKHPRRAAMHLGDSFEIQARLQNDGQKRSKRIWLKNESDEKGIYHSFEDIVARGG